jgi:hypothetical protein
VSFECGALRHLVAPNQSSKRTPYRRRLTPALDGTTHTKATHGSEAR